MESTGSEQHQRAADYGLGPERGSGWLVTSLKRCSCQGRKHSGIPCRDSLAVGQALYSQGKPLETLVKEELFAWLWLTSSFDAGRLHQARSRLFAHVRPAVPSTSAAAPASTLTLTERVQMLVNETGHLALLAAKVPALMAEMRHAISVLYRKAAGLPELETLQFVTVSGSARATAAAASWAASFAAGQAGAQPTSALPPLSAHGAGRKRGSRIQNEGEAPKKARGRGGGSRVT
ncbi:hypothetical protein T492DRAFT_455236 [Pavlovales sp. CCMP2436]|nr:hypothetical protein T492DRAFT_455236 [Pavlovales sp. CCMP2436]